MRTSSIEKAILTLLQDNNRHLTANEVTQQLQPRFPSMNPSTVYRALERLAHAGKISVSDMGTGAAVYEKVTDGMHHHLVCQRCGRVLTIDHTWVGPFFEQIEKEFSFEIATNHLILFGVCCQEEESNDKGRPNAGQQSKDCRENF